LELSSSDWNATGSRCVGVFWTAVGSPIRDGAAVPNGGSHFRVPRSPAGPLFFSPRSPREEGIRVSAPSCRR
jgi:hypothetical protein